MVMSTRCVCGRLDNASTVELVCPCSLAQQLWMLAADITDLVLSEYLQLLTVVEDERERAGLEDEFRRERSMWIQPFGMCLCSEQESTAMSLPQCFL